MNIINRSIHVIDYENNTIHARDIPATFDAYVAELISHINGNTTVRDYKTRSRQTEVISSALGVLSNRTNPTLIQELTTSIANRLLRKEVEAQSHITRLNTNVQKGSLIQALLYNEQAEKYIYLLAKVEHSTFVDDIDFSFKTGFSKDKKTIWKSCLIDMSSDSETLTAKVYSNTAAKFWSDDFLELDEMNSDEFNTLNSFRAIEAVLNTNLRGVATKDHTVIRNSFIAYYKSKEHIDFPEMVDSILGHYDPIDVDVSKISSIKEKLLHLPEKKRFDPQFESTPKVINARIRKIYDVNNGIQLRILDAIENLEDTIVAIQEPDGTRYLKIKTNNDNTYHYFRATGRIPVEV